VTDPAELDRDDAVVAPRGFRSITANVGVKDGVDECSILWSDVPAIGVGLFTKSLFAGASVLVSREVASTGRGRGVVTISGNSNVATGKAGAEHARDLQRLAAKAAGIDPDDLFVSSTGVIGRPYPPAIWGHLEHLPAAHDPAAMVKVARAIMTTDTRPKCVGATVPGSDVRIAGVAKGVGMIEPDMATLITLFLTDAAVEPEPLDAAFRRVVGRTFNALSIDTDTSTSDTAAIMASGVAGPVDPSGFEAALHAVALSLTRQIARDGEGATTLIEVTVDHARDDDQARRVAKAIVNSPLVKTAVHGADPNWGRVAMAVGKCSDDTDIDQRRVTIRFGVQEVYPEPVDEVGLAELAEYMKGDEVRIHVSLGTGHAAFTAFGCDLSDQYVRINADYTT
jgi:glutamate N-acetyltransferase/amino-acid N-acetyltransferase